MKGSEGRAGENSLWLQKPQQWWSFGWSHQSYWSINDIRRWSFRKNTFLLYYSCFTLILEFVLLWGKNWTHMNLTWMRMTRLTPAWQLEFLHQTAALCSFTQSQHSDGSWLEYYCHSRANRCVEALKDLVDTWLPALSSAVALASTLAALATHRCPIIDTYELNNHRSNR